MYLIGHMVNVALMPVEFIMLACCTVELVQLVLFCVFVNVLLKRNHRSRNILLWLGLKSER